jgi:hypothetical protein
MAFGDRPTVMKPCTPITLFTLTKAAAAARFQAAAAALCFSKHDERLCLQPKIIQQVFLHTCDVRLPSQINHQGEF